MIPEAQKLELIQIILKMQDEEVLAKVKAVLNNQPSQIIDSKPIPLGKEIQVARQFGFAKGLITYVSPDFDDTPPGFEDYLPKA